MSSIEDDLRSFYQRRLVPAAVAVHERRGNLLTGSEEADSWYVTCEPRDEFFEVESASLGKQMRTLWEQADLPELAGLADELTALAEELRGVAEESAEVSPFIYVMY